MLIKIIVYVLHLTVIFPYLFYLGLKLKKTEFDNHSQVLIPATVMGFGYQLYLLVAILIVYIKYK